MATEDDDDVYDDDYDFVDDDLDDEEEDAVDDTDDVTDDERASDEAPIRAGADRDVRTADNDADEYARPAPPTNYVVHVYEHERFKRTIDRPFTAEDAEAFASEYNRTAKPYGRFAVAGKDDVKPRKALD
jgi:hypothetical protein